MWLADDVPGVKWDFMVWQGEKYLDAQVQRIVTYSMLIVSCKVRVNFLRRMLSHMESVVHTVGVWYCFFYIDYMHHLAIPLSTAQNAPPRAALMWIDPWIYVRPGHRWLLLTLVLLMLCLGCGCDVGGAYDQYCDSNSGQCSCRPNVVGRDCSRSVLSIYMLNFNFVWFP